MDNLDKLKIGDDISIHNSSARFKFHGICDDKTAYAKWPEDRYPFLVNRDKILPLSKSDRLKSEIPTLAKEMNCFVAVNPDGEVVMSKFKMELRNKQWSPQNGYKENIIRGALFCPNSGGESLQWNNDGELIYNDNL